MTHDVNWGNQLPNLTYGWQRHLELFAVCRHCGRSTVYSVEQTDLSEQLERFLAKKNVWDLPSINDFFKVRGFIALKDMAGVSPPEFVPDNIAKIFREGATDCVTECWNSAGAMFRLCVDLASKSRLPEPGSPDINQNQRQNLGARLRWLFDNDLLPSDLQGLAQCVKDDGNDGAHDGTLEKEDAEDLQDFARALLERLYTEPAKLTLAAQRREDRRKSKS